MRSILHLSIFIPALAGAALYTGTVSSLENHPIAGVVVKLGSDSVITGHDGTWSLVGTAGVQARDAKAIDGTRHLVRDGSRLSLAWQDRDILGRGPAMRKSLPSNQRAAIAARTMASTDTIVIRWKGKNLSRIQVSASDTTIAQAIDTSWKDDAGIPWNPSIAYGSSFDTRDGQTYRTTKIGTQTWMAENSNYRNTTGAKDTVGVCYNNSADSCEKYGRLYSWTAAMGIDSMYNHTTWGGRDVKHQGICPSTWHIPSYSEWTTMQNVVDTSNTTDGAKLKSTSGWFGTGNGTDTYGFRALPGGGDVLCPGCSYTGLHGDLWSATEYDATNAWYRRMDYNFAGVNRLSHYKTLGFSLRCLED